MNQKVYRVFTLFFLIFLGISFFPILFTILQNSRQALQQGYDQWMKLQQIEVMQPTKKIASPYGEELPEEPPVIQQELSSKTERWKILFQESIVPEMKKFNDWIISSFPFRDELSTFNMAFKYHLGMKRPIENEITMILPNKKFAGDGAADIAPEIPASDIQKLLHYKKLCEQNATKFFVIFRPFEHNIHHDRYEPYKGIYLDINHKLGQRAAQLEKLDISTFKLYEAMQKQIPEDKWLNYFYMTDHHWNVDGALIGAKLIADYLNKNCGTSYDLSYFDPETYIRKRWKEIFTGSLAKKLSMQYAEKKDDFDILYPRFATDFTLEIPNLNFFKKGDFSIFIFDGHIHNNAYHTNVYGSFLNAEHPYIRIVNNKIKDGKKLIVIKDSFCNAMIPYLALQTKEIILLDPRYYPQEKIWETISKEKPDILFVLFVTGI